MWTRPHVPNTASSPFSPGMEVTVHSALFLLSKVTTPVEIPWILQTPDLSVPQGKQRAQGTETRQDHPLSPGVRHPVALHSALAPAFGLEMLLELHTV